MKFTEEEHAEMLRVWLSRGGGGGIGTGGNGGVGHEPSAGPNAAVQRARARQAEAAAHRAFRARLAAVHGLAVCECCARVNCTQGGGGS